MKQKNRHLFHLKKGTENLFELKTRKKLRAMMLVISIACMTVGTFAQPIENIDMFEQLKNWHTLGWGDASLVEYSQFWTTEGNFSLKFHNTSVGQNWTAYETDFQSELSPAQVTMDIRNASNRSYVLKVEVVNAGGISRVLGSPLTMAANTTYNNYTFPNSGGISKIRIIQDQYGSNNVVTYIDNIRFTTSTTTVWDNCEFETSTDHYSWYVANDAATGNSGTYSTTIVSNNTEFSSAASMIMEWDASAHATTKAELKTNNATEDLTGYDVLLVDVYRPETTDKNVKIKGWLWSTSSFTAAGGDDGVGIDVADQWTTIAISLNDTVSTITQIVFIVQNTTGDNATGTLYFDNLRAISTSIPPNEEIIYPSTMGGEVHMMNDFDDAQKLIRNNFYGEVQAVADGDGTLTAVSVINEGRSAVKLDYDVTPSNCNWGVVYHNNLNMNSQKDKLVLYMKGDDNTTYPDTVKLEIYDNNNNKAICWLQDINTTWQQWVVSFDPNKLKVIDPLIDMANITKISVVIPKDAKSGTGILYIDDMIFVDDLGTSITEPDNFRPEYDASETLYGDNKDEPLIWNTFSASNSTIDLSSFEGLNNDGIIYDYDVTGGWATIRTKVPQGTNPDINPLAFYLKPDRDGQVEMKLVDTDGTYFQKTLGLGFYDEWMRVVVSLDDMEFGGYLRGDDEQFGVLDSIEIGFSEGNNSALWFDEIGLATANTLSSFAPHNDPHSEDAGISTAARRALSMDAEDPLVIEYLKQLQDPVTGLVRSKANENVAQTFNNALVAMAFILKGHTAEAHAILDFYANATDITNNDVRKQNFYCNGQARGFYQQVELETLCDSTWDETHTHGTNPRWMGDNAWLLLAYKFYERQYGKEKYADITSLLLDYLRSLYRDNTFVYYKQDPSWQYTGGYLLDGWRYGDTYEPNDTNDFVDGKEVHPGGVSGHHEGNIDAWAAMRLCGVDVDVLDNIKAWIDNELTTKGEDKDYPLDLYTWRALAMGDEDPEKAALLDIPEYDFRYRKTVEFNGKTVTGLYSDPDIFTDNIWSDGFGHIICAYLSYGDRQRGYFYANELDKMLIYDTVNGVPVKSLPYAANSKGKYPWVDITEGFSSASAWYIFAKNSFNPFSSFSLYMDVPYYAEENTNYSGAACAKMMLDYVRVSDDTTQTMLQNYGTSYNWPGWYGCNDNTTQNDFLDPRGMYKALNEYERDEDYNYAYLRRDTRDEAYKDLCYWMSHEISNVPSDKNQMPSTVPTGGNYDNWVVVNGFQSNVNPELANFMVYGFYVKDPQVDGIGQDMYIQASVFGDNYFKPINISGDYWNGKYVTVDEPPVGSTNNITVQATLASAETPITNEKRFVAAEQGLKNYQLMNDKRVSGSMNGAVRGRIYFVDLDGETNDYYIVSFEKSGGVIASVTIRKSDGALKEVTFLDSPDMTYYDRIPGTRVHKSAEASLLNPFYPDATTMKLVYNGKDIIDEDEVTVIEKDNVKDIFTVMPNPANSYTRISYSLKQEGLVNISIYNISGKMVKVLLNSKQKSGEHIQQIDLSDLENGVYYLRLNKNENNNTAKIIIMR
ncbi:MAG: T9SS type A sorting domain-containing protein [Salinivirgaceae bacterium]|jgi:hypothetical protein|nr:T9SS type A sorting domain-containing protein [Salinivirgaceae bacterium]